MAQVNFPDDVNIQGGLSCNTFYPPTGCIDDDAVAVDADISDEKMLNRHCLSVYQTTGTAVVALTQDVRICRDTGTIRSFEAAITGAVPTGDYTITVDLQNGDASNAFASVLSAPISFSSATSLRTPSAGSITTAAVADGDILRVVIAVGGSSGTQGQGIVVNAEVAEQPGA